MLCPKGKKHKHKSKITKYKTKTQKIHHNGNFEILPPPLPIVVLLFDIPVMFQEGNNLNYLQLLYTTGIQ